MIDSRRSGIRLIENISYVALACSARMKEKLEMCKRKSIRDEGQTYECVVQAEEVKQG